MERSKEYREAAFGVLVGKLTKFVDDAESIKPQDTTSLSRRRARRSLRQIEKYIKRNYASPSDQQSAIIEIARELAKKRPGSGPPLLGTQRTRHRAKMLLTAQKLKPDTWLITGGELGHGVTVNDGTYTCDCGMQAGAIDRMCSHALAVRLATHGNFEK